MESSRSVTNCKDCKWWGFNTSNFITTREQTGYKCCGLTAENGCGDQPEHKDTLAYALSYEGAILYTSPEFGCVQGKKNA